MKFSEFLAKNQSKILLVAIFTLALFLRWLYLPQGALVFGYDQGRDAFIAEEILHGDLKLQGPPVGGLPGVFHGVLYYYVVAPAYLLGHGNPIIAAFWMSFLNALGVFVIYLITLKIYNKKSAALISSLVYACSFELSQYANWLSNVSLAVIFVPLIYFGLYLWLRNKNRFGPITTGLALGLSIQCNAALAYHVVPVVFWIYLYRNKLFKKSILSFFTSFLLATSSMIIAEIKFNHGGFAGLWYLFSSQDKIASSVKFGEFFVNYLNQLGNVLSFTIFPLNIAFGGLVGLFVLIFIFYLWYQSDREKFSWHMVILSAPISYAIALAFGGGSTPHITVGIASLISVMLGIILWDLSLKNKYLSILLLALILGSNITKIVIENKNGQTNFAIQEGLILSSELKAVDYSYQESIGKPFSISTLTSPLFINTTWSYLYNWYGKTKYGYLPYWIGHDQIGQLGNNLQTAPINIQKHYFIIEPTFSIPDLYIGYARGDQESISKLINKIDFGKIAVEEREMKK